MLERRQCPYIGYTTRLYRISPKFVTLMELLLSCQVLHPLNRACIELEDNDFHRCLKVDLTNLEGEWATTLNGNEFVIANDGRDDKVVIFGTAASLRLLSESSSFFVDGTFSVWPSLFYQLFTIHMMKHGQTFPMVYAFLPNKQRQTYNRAFMLLKDAALNHGLTLDPATLTSGFGRRYCTGCRAQFPKCIPPRLLLSLHASDLAKSHLDLQKSTRQRTKS